MHCHFHQGPDKDPTFSALVHEGDSIDCRFQEQRPFQSFIGSGAEESNSIAEKYQNIFSDPREQVFHNVQVIYGFQEGDWISF